MEAECFLETQKGFPEVGRKADLANRLSSSTGQHEPNRHIR